MNHTTSTLVNLGILLVQIISIWNILRSYAAARRAGMLRQYAVAWRWNGDLVAIFGLVLPHLFVWFNEKNFSDQYVLAHLVQFSIGAGLLLAWSMYHKKAAARLTGLSV